MKTTPKIFTLQFFLLALGIAFLYVLLYIVLINRQLMADALFHSGSFLYMLSLIGALLVGFPQTIPAASFIIFILNALLTGITLALLVKRLQLLKQFGKVHIVAGGSSILSIVSTGCASCGLPLLSFLGLSGLVLYLPFHGAELPYFSFLLLLVSFVVLLKTTRKALICQV